MVYLHYIAHYLGNYQ